MYKVILEKHIAKQLQKIPYSDYLKLKNAILDLAKNPRPKNSKKLKVRSAYRIRKGDYRVIQKINDNILTVLIIEAGHRRDIYD